MTLRHQSTGLGLALLWVVFLAADAAPQAKPENGPPPDPIIGGERFIKRVITDPGQGGMPAATIRLPETWRFESKIEWHFGWI